MVSESVREKFTWRSGGRVRKGGTERRIRASGNKARDIRRADTMEIGEQVSCKAAYLCRWIIYDAEWLSKAETRGERSGGKGERDGTHVRK